MGADPATEGIPYRCFSGRRVFPCVEAAPSFCLLSKERLISRSAVFRTLFALGSMTPETGDPWLPCGWGLDFNLNSHANTCLNYRFYSMYGGNFDFSQCNLS